jgi:hypothetical protein
MEQKKVKGKELEKLPYLTSIPTDGRMVPIQTFYDHSEPRWCTWAITKGALLELKVADLFHGTYISAQPADPTNDYHLPFAETVLKHFCTAEISERMHQASQDLINGLGYLEKYFILLNHSRQHKGTNTTSLVKVELEGAFGNHRSFYDILQQLINEIHARYSKSKVSLPDSFRKIVQKESNELRDKFSFPEP